VAVIPALTLFVCTPIAVYDGDGPIWCAEGPKIRLAGIAAREMDGTCRDNQPCPAIRAERSRNYLISLVGKRTGTLPTGHVKVTGPALKCTSTGGAGGDRTGAWCVSPKVGDLSCAMVRAGMALRWDKFWKRHKCG